MATPPIPPSPPNRPAPFNLGDSLGGVGVVLALIAFVLNFPVIVKVALLGIAISCFTILARHSHWTHAWPKWLQGVAAAVFAIIVLIIGIPQLKKQWRDEHPVAVAVKPVVHPETANGLQGTNPTTAKSSTVAPAKHIKKNTVFTAPTRARLSTPPAPAVVPPPTYEQKCESSACAQGPNSQATFNEYGAPKLPVITDEQRDAIRDAMRPYAGIKISIFCHNATDDSSKYAEKLAGALKDAGMIIQGPLYGMQMPSSGAVPTGFSIIYTEDRIGPVSALCNVMAGLHLVHTPIEGGRLADQQDRISITIAPNR